MDPFKQFKSQLINSIKEDGTLMLKNVRLSYPKLYVPVAIVGKDGKKSDPKYGAVFICNFTPEQKQELAAIMATFAQRLVGEGNRLPSKNYFAISGDETGKPENAGFLCLSANENENRPPVVLDGNNKATRSERDVYAGCMVDAVIRPWPQNNTFGKRVNASLVAVKFVGHNTPFGAPPVDVASKFGVAKEECQTPVSQPSASATAAEADPFGYQDPGLAQGRDEFNPFG